MTWQFRIDAQVAPFLAILLNQSSGDRLQTTRAIHQLQRIDSRKMLEIATPSARQQHDREVGTLLCEIVSSSKAFAVFEFEGTLQCVHLRAIAELGA